ncbi:hypothetical protein QE152_g17006 [Popillia japonica]|uniref:Uncharacterized protein n=1 Tax=Popillia japonica TaxID=7064 RepID=A0AAW1L5G6_POPJA
MGTCNIVGSEQKKHIQDGMNSAPPSFDEVRMKGIVEVLFLRHPERDPEVETAYTGEVPILSEEGLLQAADLIQGREAILGRMESRLR